MIFETFLDEHEDCKRIGVVVCWKKPHAIPWFIMMFPINYTFRCI